MVTKTKEQRQKYKADYRVACLSALGFLGFIIGCIFLFGSDIFDGPQNNTIFCEIEYQPNVIIDSLLKKSIDSLNMVIVQRGVLPGFRNNAIVDPNSSDSRTEMEKREALIKEKQAKQNKNIKKEETDTLALLKQQQETDITTYKTLRAYTINSGLNKAEASGFDKLNKAMRFNITPKDIVDWPIVCEGNPKKEVNVTFTDESVPFPIIGNASFEKKKPSNDIQFITKYPQVGTWLLLILIFVSFCFIAVSTCVVLSWKVIKLFKDNDIKNVKYWHYPICVLIVLICLFMLVGLWKISFYDEEVIKDMFFMPELSSTMSWIVRFGYFTGAFCLAGFIYTAGLLGFITDNLRSLRRTTESEEIKLEREQHELIFISLRKLFNTYFFLSAIVLSLMVLCTGGLYSAVNSLDFVRLLTDDWGYSPARADFVFLYGGLHTVILLMVYFPAKMRFNEYYVEDPKNTVVNSDKKTFDIIRNPLGSMKDILVAVSPLLASIMQSLLDILFQ